MPVKAIVGCIGGISCPATIRKVVKKTYTPFGSIQFQEDYIIEDDFPHTLPYEPFDEGYGFQNIPFYLSNENLILY